jgi:hypothetical protein
VRLAAVALLLAFAAAGAGCIQVEVGPPRDDDGSPSGSRGPGASASSTSSKPGALQADFTWSPQPPRAGHPVQFQPKAEGLGGHRVDTWSWDFGDNGTSRAESPSHTYAKAGGWTVTLRLMSDDGRIAQARREVFVVNPAGAGGGGGSVPGNGTGGEAPPPPPTPGIFDCGGTEVAEPNDTFGRDDAGLSWAALKTGFRFAVAWTTESPSAQTLRYSVSGGTESSVTELVPTTLHLFVLDGLPEGGWICFAAGDRPVHAARLANAMASFQPGWPHGLYTMNYLVLVNEGGDVAEVEAGLERYAEMLWDSTDGWVRAGALLVAAGDYGHHNSGWPTCAVAGSVPGACNNFYDAIVTESAHPAGAASTNREGIRSRNSSMWMNMHWQAVPGPLSLDDFGAVLLHETGHYAFDMDDLYGNVALPEECYDAATGISIMAGSRDATEFDDPVAPCPNQPAGYETSWELAQGQFHELPDRPAGPVRGPAGDGGVAFVRTYRGP